MKAKLIIISIILTVGALTARAQTLQYDFRDWVAAHLEYPPAAYEQMKEASIPVSFKVAADGTIFDVVCLANTRWESLMVREMVDAAVRAVASAPKWEPAGEEGSEAEEYRISVEFEMPQYGNAVVREPLFPHSASSEGEDDYRRNTKNLRTWLREQLEIPDDFRLSLTGIVEKGGTLGHLKSINTSDLQIAVKVMSALEDAPKWAPGLDAGGDTVRSFVYLPLNFREIAPPNESEAEVGEEEKMPTFRGGGIEKFRNWVMSRLVYPANSRQGGAQGTVLLRFVVDEQGSVTDIDVLHSPNEDLASAAVEAVTPSPKWTPGRDADSNPVKVYFLLPIQYKL
jgi:TonB family protein